ncbi:MAG TPA: hypothetical protein VGB46_01485 [Flavisolibacter sp.]|jgi:hypothetical protein
MLAIIFYALLAYILYRLVFHFILPVYRTYRRVKKGFREMHEQMESRQPGGPQQGPGPSNASQGSPNGQPKAGEYIDFEEIK